jgi:hypothetical protein
MFDDDAIQGIASWFGQQFGMTTAQAHALPDRDVVLFRVEFREQRPSLELELSEEALEDNEPEAIIEDLARQSIPGRLSADPTMRLSYYADRIVPRFERHYVQCDGKGYRIVRDASHAVRIFDAQDQLLQNTPSPLPVLPTSVFRRLKQQWCEDIRAWRGPQQ